MLPNRLTSWLPKPKPSRQRLALCVERLEERALPTVQPLTLADPSLYGASGQGASTQPSLSADGQLVAFESDAENLVPNDNNAAPDVFVYNRSTGSVTLVSMGTNGHSAGADGSSSPVISPDGRYVAFESTAGNIVSGFGNPLGFAELYLRDLATGTTSLLSAASGGTIAADQSSLDPVFSADSHHVAFLSYADDLVPGVTYHNSFGTANLFERDLTTTSTALVSRGQDGRSDAEADVSFADFSLSADGRFVTFMSIADNLAGAKYNPVHAPDVFVRDMRAGTTYQVSVNADGTGGGNAASYLAADGPADLGAATNQSISADGRYVVFDSASTDLVSNAVSGSNVYLRNLVNGTTTLISAAPDGSGPGGEGGVVSPDGRYVAFMSNRNLLPLATGFQNNVYVYDTFTRTLALASVNAAGTAAGNGESGFTRAGLGFQDGGLVFSADGSSLVFESDAANLTAGASGTHENLYLRKLAVGTTTLLTPAQAGTAGGNGDAADVPAISANGQVVAFASAASNLVAADHNGLPDIFVRDVKAATTALASVRSPLLPAAFAASGGGTLASVSADGGLAVFTSNLALHTSSQLTPTVPVIDTFATGVFVRNTQTGTVRAVDVNSGGQEVGGSRSGTISADGSTVAFLSSSLLLLPPGVTQGNVADISHYASLFVRNLTTNTTTPISLSADGTKSVDVQDGAEIAVSADGNMIAYTSPDAEGVAGVSDPGSNLAVYLYNARTGRTVLVSDIHGNGQIVGDSYYISITPDGRYVLFTTDIPLPMGGTSAVVKRWDSTTGQLITIGEGGRDYAAVMSADGNFIAYDTADATPFADEAVDRYEVATGTGEVVSFGIGSDAAIAPAISADGSTVAFFSYANLLNMPTSPPQPGPYFLTSGNIYIWRQSSGLALASTDPGGDTGDQPSNGPGPNNGVPVAPALSPNGQYLAFTTASSNIGTGFNSVGSANNSRLFIRDLITGTTRLVKYDSSGTQNANADENPDDVRFSGNSQTLFFDS